MQREKRKGKHVYNKTATKKKKEKRMNETERITKRNHCSNSLARKIKM